MLSERQRAEYAEAVAAVLRASAPKPYNEALDILAALDVGVTDAIDVLEYGLALGLLVADDTTARTLDAAHAALARESFPQLGPLTIT